MTKDNSRLKQVWKDLKLTQTEIADRLNISQTYYSAVECGKKPVSKKLSKALFDIFNVNTDWLLTGDGEIFKDAPTEAPERTIIHNIDIFKSHTPPHFLIESIAALEMLAMHCRRVAYDTHKLDSDTIDDVLRWYAESDVLNKGVKASLLIGDSHANFTMAFPK